MPPSSNNRFALFQFQQVRVKFGSASAAVAALLTQLLYAARSEAKASLQNLAAGGVALCQLANSCLMKKSFGEVLHL